MQRASREGRLAAEIDDSFAAESFTQAVQRMAVVRVKLEDASDGRVRFGG